HNGWIWRARATFKTAASFRTPDEWVYNSGFRETDFSLMAGIIRKWGYTHLHFSSFDLKPGMIEGERDSLTGRFMNAEGQVVSDVEARSRSVDVPFQVVLHRKIASVTSILSGKDQVRIGAGYQWNERKEYGESASVPGIHLDLGTFTGEFRYTRHTPAGLEMAAGASGMIQTNRNRGLEFLIPAYDLHDLGGFVYAKKSWESVTVNLGMRFDYRQVAVSSLFLDPGGNPAPAGDTLFLAFNKHFQAFTASAGMTYSPNHSLHLKLNAGRGFRAPNIAELSANGLHEGTFRYEIGSPGLNPETSLQIDGEIAWEHRLADFSFNGYINYIDQFIYLTHLSGEEKEVGGTSYPVYRFTQGNSVLKGFEIELDIHPVDALHMENNLDYVWGGNRTTGDPLPFIPALHLTDQVKWTFRTGKNSFLVKPYIQAELETHFAQRRTAPDEASTSGYTLFNAQAGTHFKVKGHLWTFTVSGTNLINKRYFDHLNRLRDIGVLNMGRRVSFSLVIPFSFELKQKTPSP
ncbi:MAG TPA: TonB-dependent receptor, partial [Bacteroidales bacterium]|nr:TonB-dependent receptor [Bacteroidales bacterium]